MLLWVTDVIFLHFTLYLLSIKNPFKQASLYYRSLLILMKLIGSVFNVFVLVQFFGLFQNLPGEP